MRKKIMAILLVIAFAFVNEIKNASVRIRNMLVMIFVIDLFISFSSFFSDISQNLLSFRILASES